MRICLSGLLAFAGSYLVCCQAAVAADPLVARGEYLARAADCASCHSPPKGAPYSGGTELKTPFGNIYGPNITSDPETGIGDWTRADFERALRLGLRKDGAYLYPAMPYPNYTKLADADIDALWAFIHSQPPVKHSPPENTFRFPFDIRTGIAAWQSLYFKPGRLQPVAGEDATWNRGAYLVQALGHCDECHTPRNVAQATETKHQLTGAQIEGWYAPDISNDPLSELQHYSVDGLAHYFKTGQGGGNTKSFGPMQEVVHNSLRYLTDADLHAMAEFLKQQRSGATSIKVAKVTISPEELQEGKRLYDDNCSSCHQFDGKGLKGQVPALAGNTAVTAPEPYNLIMAMLEGFAPQGAWGAMASFSRLSNEQIADIANYVRVSWGNSADPNATLWAVGNWRATATTPAGGQQAALDCGSLGPQVLDPALKPGPQVIRAAAVSRPKLDEVVRDYEKAVPNTNAAQTIEALSIAYCRAIVSDKIPTAQSNAKIANFSQQVAIALTQ